MSETPQHPRRGSEIGGHEIRLLTRELYIGALLAGLHVHLESILRRDADTARRYLSGQYGSNDGLYVQATFLQGVPEATETDGLLSTLCFGFANMPNIPNVNPNKYARALFYVPVGKDAPPTEPEEIDNMPIFDKAYVEIREPQPRLFRERADRVLHLAVSSHGIDAYRPRTKDDEPLDPIDWMANYPEEYADAHDTQRAAEANYVAYLLDMLEHWPELKLGKLERPE